MNKYYKNLNDEVKEYFNILSPEFPSWLLEYINTPEMKRISKISMSCGTDYSSCFNIRYWYSNLDHSVGVALIIWHFTKDKKQTLAGLFHDIATPVFKHCQLFLHILSAFNYFILHPTYIFLFCFCRLHKFVLTNRIFIGRICIK